MIRVGIVGLGKMGLSHLAMFNAHPDFEVAGICDDDPMCMLMTVSVSSQAAKNGSQWPEWIEGSPRWAGISLKHTACTPRSALRRTSAAASCTSNCPRTTRWPSRT